MMVYVEGKVWGKGVYMFYRLCTKTVNFQRLTVNKLLSTVYCQLPTFHTIIFFFVKRVYRLYKVRFEKLVAFAMAEILHINLPDNFQFNQDNLREAIPDNFYCGFEGFVM